MKSTCRSRAMKIDGIKVGGKSYRAKKKEVDAYFDYIIKSIIID